MAIQCLESYCHVGAGKATILCETLAFSFLALSLSPSCFRVDFVSLEFAESWKIKCNESLVVQETQNIWHLKCSAIERSNRERHWHREINGDIFSIIQKNSPREMNLLSGGIQIGFKLITYLWKF